MSTDPPQNVSQVFSHLSRAGEWRPGRCESRVASGADASPSGLHRREPVATSIQRLGGEVIGTINPLANADKLEVRIAAGLLREALPRKPRARRHHDANVK